MWHRTPLCLRLADHILLEFLLLLWPLFLSVLCRLHSTSPSLNAGAPRPSAVTDAPFSSLREPSVSDLRQIWLPQYAGNHRIYISSPGPISQPHNLHLMAYLGSSLDDSQGLANLVCLKLDYLCAIHWPSPFSQILHLSKGHQSPTPTLYPVCNSCQTLGSDLDASHSC